MTPADILREARQRFFNVFGFATVSDPAAALRVDGIEFANYTRALFILKRALGVSPNEPIFAWYQREESSLMMVEAGFATAITLAEAA